MKKRDIAATSLGNILEWFDFGLFIYLAPVIGKKIFPMHDSFTAHIATYSVFALGFLCRPLGGVFFGHCGDIYGRAKTLRVSILIIAISTLLMGFVPTYATAGIIAPILFTVLRLAQGLSIGGEYCGAMIYLAESAPQQQRGLITSFAASGASIGFLLATLTLMIINNYMPNALFYNWGWRLPFIAAGLFGSVLLYYRFYLCETPAYLHLKTEHSITQRPLLTAIKFAPTKLLRILGITCMSSTFYYLCFVYMPDYLVQNAGISLKTVLSLQTMLLIAMLFLIPLGGFCGDRYGRKFILILCAGSIIFLSLPFFYLLQFKSLYCLFPALSFAAIITSFDQGNNLAAIVENCPANIRYTGIGFSFNLGNALFGATAPLIATVLTQQINVVTPAYYLIIMTSIGLIAIITIPSRPAVLTLNQEKLCESG